ncbi:hypothetical protein AB0H69_00840 [Streptomyces phaeochromogenes]|uniref:hypothetical protein n=1 Tax=Streptomyces phaeochromogenes TaxID=1923 RepID=UPI0033DFE56A
MGLDDCARETRGLAAVVADPDASYDARLTAACGRVEAAVESWSSWSARCRNAP